MFYQMVPTPEEVSQCQEMVEDDADESELALCEQFFNKFRNMDNVKERLQCWISKMTFTEDFGDVDQNVKMLAEMANCIRTSKGMYVVIDCAFYFEEF